MSAVRSRLTSARRGTTAVATLATETWTGTNGAAWPAQWTIGGTGGGSATIQTNKGRLTGGAGYGSETAFLSGMAPVADTDITFTFTPPSGEHYFYVGGRSDSATPNTSNGGFPANGMGVQIGYNGSSWNYNFTRCSANTRTTFGGTVMPAALTAGTAYKIRLAVVGGTLSYRVWLASGAEPTTWHGTATDSTPYATAGKVFIAVQSGAAAASSIDLDDLTVSTA